MSSATDPIRVGLVGYGLAGAVFHGPLVASTPGMVVRSAVTSDPERQAQARKAHPDADILPSVDDLWATASDHDLVVIGTPNRFHVPIALRALALHVHPAPQSKPPITSTPASIVTLSANAPLAHASTRLPFALAAASASDA